MVTIHKRLDSFRPLVAGIVIALLLSSLALLPTSGQHASALAESNADGHVYVLNNDLSGSNSITVFNREEDGTLTPSGITSIGGIGSVAAFADGTQGSLILAHDEGTRDCLPWMPEATRFPLSMSIMDTSP